MVIVIFSVYFIHFIILFNRKRLVYLTPHTSKTLQYSPDDIYIMGGIVDKEVGLDLTGKKAVKEEIRHACLPLGQLKWKLGSKLLCLHHVRIFANNFTANFSVCLQFLQSFISVFQHSSSSEKYTQLEKSLVRECT